MKGGGGGEGKERNLLGRAVFLLEIAMGQIYSFSFFSHMKKRFFVSFFSLPSSLHSAVLLLRLI